MRRRPGSSHRSGRVGAGPRACPSFVARTHRQAGFTLVELMISLVIVSLALAIAARLLVETGQQLAEVGGEQLDAPLPAVLDLLRADVRSARTAEVLPGGALLLEDTAAGDVAWRLDGPELRRVLFDAHGAVVQDAPLLRNVTVFHAWPVGAGIGSPLVAIELTYRRHRLRLSNATLPGFQGEKRETASELLLLAPRGAGLESGW
jgi:prepilin-type N-terminal cleavage/methylation domain-containing protein